MAGPIQVRQEQNAMLSFSAGRERSKEDALVIDDKETLQKFHHAISSI
jgi:hypothetical protein